MRTLSFPSLCSPALLLLLSFAVGGECSCDACQTIPAHVEVRSSYDPRPQGTLLPEGANGTWSIEGVGQVTGSCDVSFTYNLSDGLPPDAVVSVACSSVDDTSPTAVQLFADLGDPTTWSAGDTRSVDVSADYFWNSHQCLSSPGPAATVTAVEATGGPSSDPTGVSPDYHRTFELHIEMPSAPGTGVGDGVACPGAKASLHATIWTEADDLFVAPAMQLCPTWGL
jgi:hypothetical protein